MSTRFTLRQLEYLSAVAEHGSIAAAALHTHASAGGVSQAISDLEQRLGVQLFIRQKAKAVTLTEAGTRVLRDARRLLGEAEALQDSAITTQNEISGALTVGCYATLSPFVIPPVLDEFAGAYPALRVDVIEGSGDEVISALVEGRCEIGFLYGDDMHGGLDSVVVRATRPYVVVGADHRLAGESEVSLADLEGEPLIMFDVPSARNAAQMLERAGITPNVRHFTSNIEVVRGLVARGVGYSILVQRWPIDLSYEGRPLVSLDIVGAPERTVVLAWVQGARQTRRSAALVAFCRKAFATGP